MTSYLMRHGAARAITVCCLLGLSVCAANTASAQSGIISLDSSTVFTAEDHITSSNAGPNPFRGININRFLGADRFYDAGFTGSRAILGNVEAGHAWSGHETLRHVTTQVTGTGALGTTERHATWVTHTMAGRESGRYAPYPTLYFERGMSPDSTTVSGAIATSFGSGGSFRLSTTSTATTYAPMIQTGIPGLGGQTVDVFNSSWGFSSPTGFNSLTLGVDGLVNNTGTVSVFSAGNRGPGSNTVGGIGAGYNSITVGALASDTSSPAYDSLSGFSSRGPNDFVQATTPRSGFTIRGVRAAVDITAPGQNLTLASTSQSNFYNFNLRGTSFAAPLVAGGAGLVVDAAKTLGYSNGTDGRVVKAVLLNSADKIGGWSNNLIDNGFGVLTTTQSLDYGSGAGRMNLDRTFDQFVDTGNGGMAGTTDLLSGDVISAIGWDIANVAAGASNLYFIDTLLSGGSTFAATLAWFADRNPGSFSNFSGVAEQHLADLNLSVFQFDNLIDRNILGVVAQSISLYNVVEHLWFTLPTTGFYGLRVDYAGAHWNFTGETGEDYALAWFGQAAAVPEPTSLAIASIAIPGLLVSRRRRRWRNARTANEQRAQVA